MRLRLKLLRIIMRNCKPLFFIPIIIAYCLLPGVSAIKYFYVDCFGRWDISMSG